MITAAFMLPHLPITIPDIGRGEEKKIQKTIENYVRTGEVIAVPDGLPGEMYSQKAGVGENEDITLERFEVIRHY